ncbi:hypothetical protein L1987_14132 [Smallanthus sonchifolius]|uniref:Uncharacterized protein n=1 Tax=Smallanthus sonchifolius TaxID=185202 RepID=A0ACB9J2C8_9ASTR|nr:hypothetical protein L1987_14132 [Smallanthus sonchifolius]
MVPTSGLEVDETGDNVARRFQTFLAIMTFGTGHGVPGILSDSCMVMLKIEKKEKEFYCCELRVEDELQRPIGVAGFTNLSGGIVYKFGNGNLFVEKIC